MALKTVVGEAIQVSGSPVAEIDFPTFLNLAMLMVESERRYCVRPSATARLFGRDGGYSGVFRGHNT